MDTISVLKTLTAAAGVSGDEQEIADAAAELLKPFGAVTRDRIGNVVCRIAGAGRRVLLDAHMDQIGLAVLEITPEGFLRCAPCGGADKRVLTGAEVTVCGREKLFGVVTSTPPHLRKDGDKAALPETVLIDIGLNKERAETLVRLGDRVLLRPQFRILQNDCVSAPALDDRAGLCVLLEALGILQQNGCSDDITVVFSTREETTEGGAKSAAYNAKADLCIAVDVSFAHTPRCEARGLRRTRQRRDDWLCTVADTYGVKGLDRRGKSEKYSVSNRGYGRQKRHQRRRYRDGSGRLCHRAFIDSPALYAHRRRGCIRGRCGKHRKAFGGISFRGGAVCLKPCVN